MPEPQQGIEPGDDAVSPNPASRGVVDRIALVCGAITAGTGALTLAGWALGSDALTGMETGLIPTAPNAALLFALLGSAVLVREIWPAARGIHRAAVAVALFSTALGSVTLVAFFAIGLNIDDWLFSTTDMLGAVPMGHMSSVAAFGFVLAGVSLLQLEWQARQWAAKLGTLITVAGTVCLIGYWFGAPLLYGGTVIPVALPTSLGLTALGVGLTAAAGPGVWPLNNFIGHSTRARLLRALLPTVVLLSLIHDWITAILLEHSDPGVVLASATSAITFLLVVCYVVTRVSGGIGDDVDRMRAERKRAEQALEESEARYHDLYENAPDMYVSVDAATGCMIHCNQTYLSATGYSREDVIGQPVFEFHHPASREAAQRAFKHFTTTGQVRDAELILQRKDGSTLPVSLNASAVRDAQGRILHSRSVLRDITERKQAESMLTQRTAEVKAAYRKLAETEEQERRALARELHDQVGQNLTALNLNLNRLNDGFADSLTSEPRARVSDSLALVEDTAQRIRDIMSFLRPPILDDYGLFATLRWWVHESATRSGIAIQLTGAEVEPRLPSNVELTLFRVAQEALRNAIKHSGAKHITVSFEMLPGSVRLGVSDDGRGMVPDAGAEALVGSTWGILSMRERAEAIGGRLRVESTPGTGVRVVVEVARNQP